MRRRPAVTQLLAILFVGITLCPLASAGQNNEDVGAKPAKWDGQLTEKAEALILREIDALGKRARAQLSLADLARVEAVIDRQLKGLREWARDATFRAESKPSMGPFFSEFLRDREKGFDIRRAPHMLKGAGIAGFVVGSKSKGKTERHESSFSWIDTDGRFVKEWSEENPIDEEYRVHVTGNLRLYLLVEVPAAGKLIRVEAETKRAIMKRHPIVLKGSEATIRQVPLRSNPP